MEIRISNFEFRIADLKPHGKQELKKLGFKPQFDLESGWRETIQEMRKMDEL